MSVTVCKPISDALVINNMSINSRFQIAMRAIEQINPMPPNTLFAETESPELNISFKNFFITTNIK